VPADVHVDAGVEDDVDPGRPRRLLDRGQVARLLVGIAERAARGVVGVLEVQPDGAGRDQALCELAGRQPVARLKVRRHRHLDGRRHPLHGREHLAHRGALAVVEPERPGHAAARRRNGGQARADDDARARGVPRVEQQQRVARGIQLAQAPGEGGEVGHEAQATTP